MGLKRFLEKAGVELTHDKGLGLCLQESVLTLFQCVLKYLSVFFYCSTEGPSSQTPT